MSEMSSWYAAFPRGASWSSLSRSDVRRARRARRLPPLALAPAARRADEAPREDEPESWLVLRAIVCV